MKYNADPFVSMMIENALALGKTLKAGAAKYDFVSLKKLVFEDKKLTLDEIKEAMDIIGKEKNMVKYNR